MNATSLRVKVLALVVGAALFGVIQGWLFQNAVPIPQIENSGWFLNSGTGVRTVGLTFAIAGALVGLSRRKAAMEATMVAAGAAMTMIVVLYSIGAGTIFPIVIGFGMVILGVATAVGLALGLVIRRTLVRP